MKYMHRLLPIMVLVACSLDAESLSADRVDYNERYHYGTIFKEVFEDAFNINFNLISWDTFKVIATTTPAYTIARIIDEDFQSCFYDRTHHRNCRKLPKWCDTAAEKIIAIPIIVFGLEALFSKKLELQKASQVYLTGFPFVLFGKDIIKKFRAKACLRPWHENFGCNKRSGGGFPSGHLAESAYTAILFGMRYGPKAAIPLSLMTAFVGFTFIACNRHYLSQVVAGIGFGAMYALAANTVVEHRLAEHWLKLQVSGNEQGGTDVKLSYAF